MKGFMEQSGLTDLCIDIEDLSEKTLIDKFNYLENNYDNIKERLEKASNNALKKSLKTTELICDYIDKNM